MPDSLDPRNWKIETPTEPGFHAVVTPETTACRTLHMFRLNLKAGTTHTLANERLELAGAVVAGAVELKVNGRGTSLGLKDAFYLPAGLAAEFSARQNTVIYLGGAVYEGVGEFYTLPFDPAMPLGDIHQIHAEPPMRREVIITLNPAVPASRLLTGISWNDPGGWSSWPPHQHEEYFDEAYWYFDMDPPHFGLHLCYRQAGEPDVVHVVHSGDCLITPRGYQSNVAPPGFRNMYFWVAAFHQPEQRSRFLSLAENDPNYA